MNRFQFLRHFAYGKILDVGSGDKPIFHDFKNVIEVDNLNYIYQPKAGFKPDGTQVIANIKEWREGEIKKVFNVYRKRNFIIADGCNLPFKNEQFNTVCLAEVLEHVPEPLLLIKEAERVLKKNGLVLITVPDEYAWDKSLCPFEHSGHIHFFKERDLRKLIKQSGLKLRLFYHTIPEWNFGFVFWYIILEKN